MLNFARLTDSQVFTNKSPFGEKILEQNSYFGHYSGFFKFVVSFQMAVSPIRNSFQNIVLYCFDFTKIFVKFRFSPLLKAS